MKKLLMVALVATTITGSAQAGMFNNIGTEIRNAVMHAKRTQEKINSLQNKVKNPAQKKELQKALRDIGRTIGHLENL